MSLVLPWAIFLGATAQLFACINDFKHDNTFGATAFGAYAFFWYAMGFTWLIQNGVFGEKLAATADTKQLGFAFFRIFNIYNVHDNWSNGNSQSIIHNICFN